MLTPGGCNQSWSRVSGTPRPTPDSIFILGSQVKKKRARAMELEFPLSLWISYSITRPRK